MALDAIAIKAGIPAGQLEDLLAGKAPVMLANKLALSTGVIQAFLDGMVHPGISAPLGLPHAGLQPLADRLGKGGRIGFLFGFMLSGGPQVGRRVVVERPDEAGGEEE